MLLISASVRTGGCNPRAVHSAQQRRPDL